MKLIVSPALLVIITALVLAAKPGQGGKYDQSELLARMDSILKASIPAYAQFPGRGFFVFDLTDPVNRYIPEPFANANTQITFVDGHFYHFAPVEFAISESHLAVLEAGKLKVFKSINCSHSVDQLKDVLAYARRTGKADRQTKELLTRLSNYRRYGFYVTTDSTRVSCNNDTTPPLNPDRVYERSEILEQLSRILEDSVSESVKKQYPRFSVEEGRANGFFVYDLTDPANKQTSLLERVDFKDRHVYHFAYIDLPFSYSQVVVLEHGKLKVFRNLNCDSSGDRLKELVQYLSRTSRRDRNLSALIGRVKNYRRYGVYSSLGGLSQPQCAEALTK